MRSAAASISSVVVRPLPHSRAIRRNGALVAPAIGARRASEGISTGPIFMPAVYQPARYGRLRLQVPNGTKGPHRAPTATSTEVRELPDVVLSVDPFRRK